MAYFKTYPNHLICQALLLMGTHLHELVNRGRSSPPVVPSGPSQVFSQVIIHGFDLSKSVEEAVQAVREYGELLGLAPELVEDAVAYTEAKYQFYQREPGNELVNRGRSSPPVVPSGPSVNSPVSSPI